MGHRRNYINNAAIMTTFVVAGMFGLSWGSFWAFLITFVILISILNALRILR